MIDDTKVPARATTALQPFRPLDGGVGLLVKSNVPIDVWLMPATVWAAWRAGNCKGLPDGPASLLHRVTFSMNLLNVPEGVKDPLVIVLRNPGDKVAKVTTQLRILEPKDSK